MRKKIKIMILNFVILLTVMFSTFCDSQESKIAAIVHMANNAKAVDWAATHGANGVEMDLNFYPDGRVNVFQHGGICDCSFKCPIVDMCNATSICRILWNATGSNCNAHETPENMMAEIARHADSLAIVYIDSKLSDLGSASTSLESAGHNVIKLLDTAFAAGFKGQVIISAPKMTDTLYLSSAIKAADQSPYKNNYFFTIDGEESHFSDTMKTLTDLTFRRIYSTGISADVAMRFYTVTQLAKMNLDNASIGGIVIWTIDKNTSINDYLNLGANLIITNELPNLLAAIQASHKTLAKPGELLFTATSNHIVGYGSSECSHNNECKNNACGRITAADNAPLVCCKSNHLDSYWGYDYCTQMPDGSICWSDAMCAAGYCKNNAGGTKKGICGREVNSKFPILIMRL